MSLSADELPEFHFDAWHEMLSQQAMPLIVRTSDRAGFTGRVRSAAFGALRIVVTENGSVDVNRTPALIRRSDPEALLLVFSFQGEQLMSQTRQGAALGPGDMVLLHSSREFLSESDPRLARQVGSVVMLDPSLLPFDPNRLSGLLGTRFPSTDGVNSLVSRFLYKLGTEGSRLDPADAVRLSTATMDLIMVMLSRRLGLEQGLPPETRDSARFARIQAYAIARLGDPDLDPETIAAAHHISVRTLHRLFQLHAVTVAGWIRHARLTRCQRDLADPLLADRSIASIGTRWGYPDPAQLSRAFKQAYGMSPQAFRAHHRTAAEGA